MLDYVELAPAYGRIVSTKADLKADWDANKDFKDTATGSYTNKSYILSQGIRVTFRYGKRLEKVTTL